ncbi:MAG TPA: murein biosynthesis integral membrane protein MurJ, partial [Jiangellaceae bacterium]|nr:murein biosynthesis integral membrane protein MurJ [Jiangellaceae bacterium]
MTRTQHRRARSSGLLGSSAVMAAGTVVSRLTGFGRAAMISAALGLAVTADVFNVANVLPNMLYILVGGGVLNSVLVPALVRAIKNDADGGQAYSQRLYSVLITVLGIATVVSVLAAPALLRLVVDQSYLEPDMRPFFDNMVVIARFCLPQIFFYGLYVLIGQMLNAKGRFGPMMWAPILNNAVAIVVFALFIAVYGTKSGEVLTTAEMALIGLGSTLGVVAQALCLIPVLRTTGFSLRFRTDWKGHGLSEPVKLGLWTFGFVAVNQVAYLFFVRVATGASAIGADGTSAAGYTVYANAMLIMMVPHSVITVSLATALLPRLSELAADGDLDEVRKKISSALRMCLAIIIPIGALMAALAFPLAALIFNYGAAAGQTGTVAATLVALLPGLVGFTVHYLSLRGFYALQDTKTPFFTQVWVAGAMVVWAVGMSVFAPDASVVTVVLGIGYSVAYVVGASVSLIRLQHHIGGSLHIGSLVGHLFKVGVPAALAAAVAYLTSVGWSQLGLEDVLPNILAQLLELAICGSVGVAVYVGLAYAVGIREVRMGIALFASKVLRREVTVPDDQTALEPAEDLHDAHTGTLSIFRRPALDPEMTAEFFLDETLPGVPGFWDTAATASVAAAPAPPIRPSMGAGRTGVDDRAPTLDVDTQPDLLLDARRAVTTDTARPHQTLAGRFQLEELLDDSGGVRSWRALDQVLRRPVFLQSVSAADPRAHAFGAAARRASTVADPRFLRVLDVGTDDVAYLVREWTPGRSLLDLLSDGAFHPAHAAAISREVADALTGAHAQGLSHRRLDP